MRNAPNKIKFLVKFPAHLRVKICKGALMPLNLHYFFGNIPWLNYLPCSDRF